MRIIAGQKKGHKLLSLPGNKTRPTTDYVKEAIFSIIFDCTDLRVLDLFSGSGGLGFEALSRGARSLEMVDRSEKAVQIAKKNIAKLQYEEVTTVHKQRVDVFLRNTEGEFDLILLDPPYNQNYVNSTLAEIFAEAILAKEGLIIVEHSTQEKIKEDLIPRIIKQKKYGDTYITLLKDC
jgi:16S rRNA (guanine966-N2)-methyltransferase